MTSVHHRLVIAQAVERQGANAVAKSLGVSRNALLSYCAGASREGTRFLIEARAERLDGAAPAGEAKAP